MDLTKFVLAVDSDSFWLDMGTTLPFPMDISQIPEGKKDKDIEYIREHYEEMQKQVEAGKDWIQRLMVVETPEESRPGSPDEAFKTHQGVPFQNALDEMKVSDTEAFDWKSVRPDFDPEKHEWLKVVIQRGKNHTTVTKIPTGPALFSYGFPETEVVIAKGQFSVEELTEFAAELSEIFAQWVAGKSK